MQFAIQNIYPTNYSAKQTNWSKHFGYVLYHARSASVPTDFIVLVYLKTLLRCLVEKLDRICLRNKSFDKKFLKLNLQVEKIFAYTWLLMNCCYFSESCFPRERSDLSSNVAHA